MQSEQPAQRSVGPYRLEAVLGRGGMGVVYSARDERLGRHVAIKHLRAERKQSERARRRLRREARAIAAISHPAIVQIFDLLETEAGDWIVMERIEGPTVAELLRAGPLDLRSTVRMAREVASGLAFAHERGFVHRDLKAENVILSPQHGAKILDFGLCKQLEGGGEGDEASLTLDSGLVGTGRAMSPEQARGYRADGRSDLFSLGVLLYECLAGTSPFEAETVVDTIARVCTFQQTPLHELNPDLPAGLSLLVEHLLQKLPEHRPESAAEVGERLAEIASEMLEARTGLSPSKPTAEKEGFRDVPTVGWIAETAKASATPGAARGRSRRWWILGAALLALTIAGLATLPWLHAGRETSAEPAEASPLGARESIRLGSEMLRRLYHEDRVEKAAELFENALRLEPENPRALAGLCRVHVTRYARRRDPLWLDRAAEQGELAVRFESRLARAHACLGDVLYYRGSNEEALARLDEAILLKPLAADHHARRGTVLFALGRHEEARAAFTRAIEIEPEGWLAYERQGFVELRLGRNEVARDSLARAAELAPENAAIRKNLGAAYFRLGRLEEAATELQRSLEIEPYPATYTNLGTLEFYRGRYQAALAAFEKAVETGAHHYLAWANLGDAQRFLPGRGEESKESFRRAVQLLEEELARDPRDQALVSRMALYRAKSGAVEEALRVLAGFDLAQTESPRVLYRAAQVHEIAGRRAQALEVLASALGSGFPLAEASRDPELTELRQDPRFHRLAARYHEP